MRNFEKNPEGMKAEEPDAKGHMEELRHGKYSPLPEEIQRIRKEVKEGEDPDLAEQKFKKKMDEATARLRMTQREEALRSLERASKNRKPKK